MFFYVITNLSSTSLSATFIFGARNLDSRCIWYETLVPKTGNTNWSRFTAPVSGAYVFGITFCRNLVLILHAYLILFVCQSELFVLATDQGFLNESNVVWETLSNVEGDGHFVDATFHTYRLPQMPSQRVAPAVVTTSAFPAPPANSKEQIDHEYVTFCAACT